MSATPQPRAILRRKQVEARTGLSRATIYVRMNPKSKGYDPAFPTPIRLGEKAVGWLESEVDAWIGARIALSAKGARA